MNLDYLVTLAGIINWNYFIAVAVVVQSIAFLIWNLLSARLERWIFWTVWAGFVFTGWHRINELLWQSPAVSAVTALFLAFLALAATTQTRALLSVRELAKRRLIELRAKMDTVQPGVRQSSVAAQIAEMMVELKDQLSYYEGQAKAHDLPTFHEHHLNK